MRIGLKLKPGQRGTKKLCQEYGNSLLCVRYHYDAEKKKRFKTVELIIAEADWQPKARDKERVVGIEIAWGDGLWRKVKAAGGKWNSDKKVWELAYGKVLELGLAARIKD